jgi:integrase
MAQKEFRFTKSAIEKLPIPAKPESVKGKKRSGGYVYYHDTEEPGLCLRVSFTGRKTLCWYRSVKNRPERLTIGDYQNLSIEAARRIAAKYNAEKGAKNSPATAAREKREAGTFGELAAEYLKRHAIKKKSHSEDKRIIEKDICPRRGGWTNRKVEDITRRDVRALLDRIVERGAPIAANRTLALVRAIFNFGIKEEMSTVNPAARIEPPGTETERERVLSDVEIKAFWDKLPMTEMEETTKRALRLMLITAQRRGEVCSMEWDELDVEGGWWTIPASKAKNAKTHRVPLSKLALKVIAESPREGHYVLASSRVAGKHIQGLAVSHAVRKNRQFWGIDRFTPHDLRRTAASAMASEGVSRDIVGKVLNHAEKGVTAVYDRYGYDTEKRDALELWSRKLERILFGVQEQKVIELHRR